MQAKFETITPEMAALYLKKCKNFRSVRPRSVSDYARDMRENKWDINGESIKFDKDGFNIDGRHRLSACVESDTPFTVLVVRGIDSDENIDNGLKRSAAMVFQKHGEINVTNLAASLGILQRYFNGDLKFSRSGVGVTTKELQKTLEDHQGIRESIQRFGSRQQIGFVSLSAALHYIFAQNASIEIADDFFEGLLSGANLEAFDSRLHLRNRMIAIKSGKLNMPRKEMAALIIKAWNFYLEGKEVKKLDFRTKGEFIEQFPKVRKYTGFQQTQPRRVSAMANA